MEKTEILSEINKIFIEVLDNQNIVLTNDTNAKDIEEWDSLSNIYIIVELEKIFNCRFKTKEIRSWENIGSIIDSIISKQHESI